jgi:hypothetical protein
LADKFTLVPDYMSLNIKIYITEKHDVDEDKDCEKQEDHSKRFHRFNREHRNVVLVIGTVIICIVIVSIVGVW